VKILYTIFLYFALIVGILSLVLIFGTIFIDVVWPELKILCHKRKVKWNMNINHKHPIGYIKCTDMTDGRISYAPMYKDGTVGEWDRQK